MTSFILAIIILWGGPSLLYILYLRSMVKNSDQIIRNETGNKTDIYLKQ